MTEKFEYQAREINWNNYKSAIPIVVRDEQSLDIVKYYIESVLHSYETSTSSTKLILVGTVSFTVSRMVKVSGRIK